MSELKTKPNDSSVSAFINSIEDPAKREDSKSLLKLLSEITAEQPVMWGSSIIGFGSYHYKYASRREGDWFVAGFSPRKQSLTLYIMGGIKDLEYLKSWENTKPEKAACISKGFPMWTWKF